MIYFFINILMYFVVIMFLIKYYYHRMNIINLIIILFYMNVSFIFIYKNINFLYGILMLIITLILAYFFNLIIQNNKECITLWDEPEVSLHIEWQRKLIRVIRQLNPNMQLIIATHSPSILFEGWEKRVLNIEDYLKDE